MLEIKGRANIFLTWVVGGVVIALTGLAFRDSLMDGGFPWRALPPGLVIAGAICAGLGIWKALDMQPVVVVDARGFVDRTSLPHRAFIWSEIEGFRLVPEGARNPKFLAIDLADPEKVISRALYGTTTMLESFHGQFGTPCVIVLRTLEIEPNNLIERLKSCLKQHKR
ncbi:MAG TPA: STM3941 family protein [Dokdonella sp.]|uniref:STM3941 family protein n=1 Tax=Dokdonella sp. TaxID=2291710 RepID=UPI002D801EF2|nr:STM3941 family protein [Dokdonella sp.]HET9034115.1 STM3941 family protein [Dokdonella sp.]